MVQVITPANRSLYADALENMFGMRFRVAVEELGWSLPNSGGVDRDQFDRDDTVYFIDCDERGRVIGTGRLNPTTQPHLMSDVFPEFCSFGDVPRGPEIYEFSRFLVQKTDVDRRRNVQAQARICLAVVEYCLAAGIEQVTWLTYKKSYPLALRMWDCKPLGLPRYVPDDDAEYIAAISDMNMRSLNRTRELARIQDDVCRITLPLKFLPQIGSAADPRTAAFG